MPQMYIVCILLLLILSCVPWIELINCLNWIELTYAVKALSEQALKAYNSLLSVFTRIKLDIKTKLSLFDSMVVPILLYGSEVWGIYENKEIDKLHIKFCKRILGVRQQTPNIAVLGELGRFPLSVISKQPSIIYWSKIMKKTNSIEIKVFNEQRLLNNNNIWAGKMLMFLNSLGFGDVWYHFNTNINYSYIFKQWFVLTIFANMEYFCTKYAKARLL